MKIRPVGGEFFNAGGRKDERTDLTNLTFAFRNFANAPKKHKELLGLRPGYDCCTRQHHS